MAWIVLNLVHYHSARLRALERVAGFDVHAVALRDSDDVGVLEHHVGALDPYRTTILFSNRSSLPPRFVVRARLHKVLDEINPTVVCVNGWSLYGSWEGLDWCLSRGRAPVLMSESNRHDRPRYPLTEGVKRKFVGACAAAVVGGKTHAAYLEVLGMAPERIFRGYDVVDNAFFITGAEEARRSAASTRAALLLPPRFLLASARLTPKKNLACTILAYKLLTERKSVSLPDLVILGDGTERQALEKLAWDLNLSDHIHFHGFQPYSKLPAYYALAEVFIHSSIFEQWGLVVNEAMACGTPVVVSDKCGCSPDLVIEGHTGFQFDPHNPEDLAKKLERIVLDKDLRRNLSLNCVSHISLWDSDTFARGVKNAAIAALAYRSVRGIGTTSLVAALSRL